MVPTGLRAAHRPVVGSGRHGSVLVPVFFLSVVHFFGKSSPWSFCLAASSPPSPVRTDSLYSDSPFQTDSASSSPRSERTQGGSPIPVVAQQTPAAGSSSPTFPAHSFQRLWKVSDGLDGLTETARRASQARENMAFGYSPRGKGFAPPRDPEQVARAVLGPTSGMVSTFPSPLSIASPFPSMWPRAAAAQVPLSVRRRRIRKIADAAARRERSPELLTDPQFRQPLSSQWNEITAPPLSPYTPLPRRGRTGEAPVVFSPRETTWQNGSWTPPTPTAWRPSPVLDPWPTFRQWAALQPGRRKGGPGPSFTPRPVTSPWMPRSSVMSSGALGHPQPRPSVRAAHFSENLAISGEPLSRPFDGSRAAFSFVPSASPPDSW